MRKDMAKLLVEDGRRGAAGSEIRTRIQRRHFNDPSSFEDAPTRGPTSRHRLYGWYNKELNETLNPLARFLESKVGELWDDVYSEIRENLRFENTVQQHIMQHLWGYVDRTVTLSDTGVPVRPSRITRLYEAEVHTVNGRAGWIPATSYRAGSYDFYVHPETGRLERLPVVERAPYKAPTVVLYRDGMVVGLPYRLTEAAVSDRVFRRYSLPNASPPKQREYGKHWFEMETRRLGDVTWGSPVVRNAPTAPLPKNEHSRNIALSLERTFLDHGPEDYYFGPVGTKTAENAAKRLYDGRLPSFYVVRPKRQLNSRELRRLGLTNGR